MGFLVKKLLSAWLQPLPLGLLAVALGLWWRRSDAKRRRGGWLAASGLLLIYLASLPPVAFALLAPLEAGMAGYPPDGSAGGSAVAAVVALGAGYHPVVGRPPTSQVSGASVVRVTEAVRILRTHPEAKLHCTGWGDVWPGSNAAAACAIAVALGVEASRTVVHPTPRDTEEEAQVMAQAVGDQPVVLVTHASHMPRALALFRRYGVRATPAPTGHVSPRSPRWTLMPSARALGTTSGALHEWEGRLWLWIKRQITTSQGA